MYMISRRQAAVPPPPLWYTFRKRSRRDAGRAKWPTLKTLTTSKQIFNFRLAHQTTGEGAGTDLEPILVKGGMGGGVEEEGREARRYGRRGEDRWRD